MLSSNLSSKRATAPEPIKSIDEKQCKVLPEANSNLDAVVDKSICESAETQIKDYEDGVKVITDEVEIEKNGEVVLENKPNVEVVVENVEKVVEIAPKTDEKIVEPINDDQTHVEKFKNLNIADGEIPVKTVDTSLKNLDINEASLAENENNQSLQAPSKKRSYEQITNNESPQKQDEDQAIEMRGTSEDKPLSPSSKRLKVDEILPSVSPDVITKSSLFANDEKEEKNIAPIEAPEKEVEAEFSPIVVKENSVSLEAKIPIDAIDPAKPEVIDDNIPAENSIKILSEAKDETTSKDEFAKLNDTKIDVPVIESKQIDSEKVENIEDQYFAEINKTSNNAENQPEIPKDDDQIKEPTDKLIEESK